MLNIIVCIKAVPDPEKADSIKIDAKTKNLIRKDIPVVLNPLDRFALEQALELKRCHQGSVTVISMGPPSSEFIVKECMALGADKGILLCDPAFGGADAYATAFTLSEGIKKQGNIDLILCGMASSDGATEWVGPQIAAFLDLPVVTMVNKIEAFNTESWTVQADFEHGYRRVRGTLPAVFTVTRDLNEPKTLSFSGIIKARKKQVDVLNLQQLGVDETKVGAIGSPTIVSDMVPTQNKRQVTMIEGTRTEKIDEMVRLLKDFKQAR